jgi:hypothetical protein
MNPMKRQNNDQRKQRISEDDLSIKISQATPRLKIKYLIAELTAPH